MTYARKYHRIDGWRGYMIPAGALAGASDTGTWPDSPCPTPDVMAEIERFRKECLRANGIRSRVTGGETSNVCCGKRWVIVAREDFERSVALAQGWLQQHDRELRYLHDADLEPQLTKV